MCVCQLGSKLLLLFLRNDQPIDRLKKCFTAPNGWKTLKWCPISLPFVNSFIILFMSIIISFIKIFHFKSWLLHFISPFSLFLIPRLYRWWVNSSLRSEESEISDSLSEESESETCFAHLKGFGKLVELGVAFVFTMHVWMIWHIEIRNPPNNLMWSWKWFQCKVFKGQRSLMWFLNNNPI